MNMNRMAFLAAGAFLPAGCTYDADGRYLGMHMMGYGHGGFMWLIWVLIIAAVVYLLVSQSRRSGGPPARSGGPDAESALDILKKRYARGELTKEEFESIKKDIES